MFVGWLVDTFSATASKAELAFTVAMLHYNFHQALDF